jgi:hypothetical protein
MAEKPKEKETKAVTPWRPLMDLTRWERDMERVLRQKDETVVRGKMAENCRNGTDGPGSGPL